jgi:hypothetical protein
MMNLFFIYYTVLRGFVKGIGWQRSFLAGCLLQIFVEILLNETMECLWMHCFVPSLVHSEVSRAFHFLDEAITTLCFASPDDNQIYFLDAPQYLFVSVNVTNKFPDLLESHIVRAYRNHAPIESMSRQWRGSDVSFTAKYRRWAVLVASLVTTLQIIAASPFIIQRILIRLLQPWILAAISMCFIYLWKNPIALAFVCFSFVGVASFGIYKYNADRRRGESITPQLVISDSTNDDYVDSELPNEVLGEGDDMVCSNKDSNSISSGSVHSDCNLPETTFDGNMLSNIDDVRRTPRLSTASHEFSSDSGPDCSLLSFESAGSMFSESSIFLPTRIHVPISNMRPIFNRIPVISNESNSSLHSSLDTASSMESVASNISRDAVHFIVENFASEVAFESNSGSSSDDSSNCTPVADGVMAADHDDLSVGSLV